MTWGCRNALGDAIDAISELIPWNPQETHGNTIFHLNKINQLYRHEYRVFMGKNLSKLSLGAPNSLGFQQFPLLSDASSGEALGTVARKIPQNPWDFCWSFLVLPRKYLKMGEQCVFVVG